MRWDAICGQLYKGIYCPSILIVDQLDPEDITLLARDFHDQQTIMWNFRFIRQIYPDKRLANLLICGKKIREKKERCRKVYIAAQ